MDSTTIFPFLLLVSCSSTFTGAYDFIDAPFELNKIGAVASFPDASLQKDKAQVKSKGVNPLQKLLKKRYDMVGIPQTTTASPMELHGRQAPISTTPSTIDDYNFANNNLFPYSYSPYNIEDSNSPMVSLQGNDKFQQLESREENRTPYATKGNSYATSKVDGYIMVDGKMQRFSRASSSFNGKPVTGHSSVLKPVTLYMPTSQLSNKGEPEMTAVQGYVIGRQGSLGMSPEMHKTNDYGEQSQPREYTMFVYPEKQYKENNYYDISQHMPFTTPSPLSSDHSLRNNAQKLSPADDYRIPSGKEAGHQWLDVAAMDARKSAAGGYYEEPAYNSYSSDNGQAYNEDNLRRGQKYDKMDNHERPRSTYTQSYDNNARYESAEPRYQNNQPAYGELQNYEQAQPYYEDNYDVYNRDESNYDGDYRGRSSTNTEQQQSYNEQPQESYQQEQPQEQQQQPSYGGQQNNNKGSFIQHSPPITRFIPYLNLNGNLVPQFKDGRYQAPSFDVSDGNSKRARLPNNAYSIYDNSIPVVPYGFAAKRIFIACPPVHESFCTKSGHFSHPAHGSCFVQCDERKVAYVKTCPKETEWRQNTHSCV